MFNKTIFKHTFKSNFKICLIITLVLSVMNGVMIAVFEPSTINSITNMVKDDMTLLIVSHEEEFVNKISDKIIHIQNGKVIIQDNRKKKEIE